MASLWFVCVAGITFFGVLTAGTSVVEHNMEEDLLSRMDAIEDRVASLGDEVASLGSRLTEIDGRKKPEPKEFELLNLTRRHDPQTSTVAYTLLYRAQAELQVVVANNEWDPPIEVAHDFGTVHFSMPDTEVSPVVHVRTSSNLIYTLILLQASGGPPPESPEEMANIVLTTTPEHSLPFEENEELELTLLSHVTGKRTVKKDALVYYAYILKDHIVNFVAPSNFELYKENVGNDVAGDDVHAVNDDEEGGEAERLHLLSHSRTGKDTKDRVKLITGHEDSGVLYVQKRVEFLCRSCVLYELRVTKPLPYYVDDGLYTLPEGALVAYKDMYGFGPDFKGPRYFRYIRYNQSAQQAHTFQKTCHEGHPCQLVCEVFGDNPTAYFALFGRSLNTQPSYFDQSGTPLSDGASPSSAKVKGWSLKFGYVAFSVIQFHEVRKQHAGAYDCHSYIDSGLAMRRSYSLSVV